MTRIFKVYTPAAFGGKACEQADGFVQAQQCNLVSCVGGG